jgi:tetratricopeptide (TPR) repeat protein
VAIDREKVLAAAQKYVEKKKYDRAVIEYQKVIQEDPNDARTLLKIGDLQSKMEAYADAVATYERVGKFYASQGFALKAIAVYKQIREIIAKHVPQLEERYGHITPKLAELYQQLGLTSDALAALDEVATRFQRQNRDPEAIEVFRRIVELDPTNPLPHLRLAEALSRAKDTDGAVAEFATAAGQLAKLGRRDDALKVTERLLHHRADPVHARVAAELYLARNQPNDGLQALSKLQLCFQANPRDLDTLGLLSKAFNHIGQAAKGIEVQKEMARIARDSGKSELFHEIINRLQKLAPNDEQVKQLALGSMAPPPPVASSMPPEPLPRASAQLDHGRPSRPREPDPEIESRTSALPDDESYEDVGDGDFEHDDQEEHDEQPLELSRRSRHPQPDGDVLVESSIEVVEEVGEPASAQTSEQAARILADAASFRRARFHAKAIETLRIGLEVAPRSVEVHEMLRDVLLETGQTDDAVPVMLGLAGLLIDMLDGEAAARSLQDVLGLDPHNDRATEMLRELGYELVEEPSSPPVSAPERLPPMRPEYQSTSSYDPEAPLPSYDLEEIGPEDVALRSYSEPSMRTAPAMAAPALRGSLDDVDDPFDAPLPSFPLDPPAESEAAFELVPPAQRLDATDQYDGLEPGDATAIAAAPTPELESALEEAEFFATRGLYDDARTILQEQLARLPNHPLLAERLAELDAQERGTAGGSGTRPSPAAAAAQADAAADEDRAFDIAASLGALDGGDRRSDVGPPSFSRAHEQVDVEEVFAKFKEGVAKQIGVDDAQSHYDLGVAYKEMALLDDAIREFDTAARDPKRTCICQSMIGMIQLERGNLNEAIDAFVRGLQAPDRTKEQEAALCYEIGAAYEVKRMSKQALDHFQRAARLVPSFRDVQDRIRRLTKVEPKQPQRAVAVGADDEFDRAFDDILGSGKLP